MFFTHPRETINYRYQRRLVAVLNGKILNDSMVDKNKSQSQMAARIREFNILSRWRWTPRQCPEICGIGYGRRMDALGQDLLPEDREKQKLYISLAQRMVHQFCY